MIIYKPKLIEKRKQILQSTIDFLIQLKKDNDKDNGDSIINENRNLFYTWEFADKDIERIKELLNADLTLKMSMNNYHKIYPSLNRISSSPVFNRIYEFFLKGRDRGILH